MKNKLVLIFNDGDTPATLPGNCFVFDNEMDTEEYFKSLDLFSHFVVRETYFEYIVRSWSDHKYIGTLHKAKYL